MVNVLRKQPVATVRDTAALEIFRHQWQLYRKFLTHDYLSNAGAYVELHRLLTDELARPYDFLDLACGDASGIVTALRGTPIAHYCGIDLAPPALELAEIVLGEPECRRRHADAAAVGNWRTAQLRHDPAGVAARNLQEIVRMLQLIGQQAMQLDVGAGARHAVACELLAL